MDFNIILGAWISVLLTLSVFSYLYKDNPFYRTAEHLFVGVSAGYGLSLSFWKQIQPNLFGRLWPSTEYSEESLWYGLYDVLSWFAVSIFPAGGIDKGHKIEYIYIFPLILGVMMLLSLIPRFSWFARWGIAYTVGMAAGLRAYGYLNSNVLGQVKGTIVDVLEPGLPIFSLSSPSIFNNILILVGTVTGLLYFYFSSEHKGVLGKVSKTGIYFLMISFGASFGFAVMGRISLLIGRFVDLIKYSDSQYNYATYWVFLIVIIVLGYAAFNHNDESKTQV